MLLNHAPIVMGTSYLKQGLQIIVRDGTGKILRPHNETYGVNRFKFTQLSTIKGLIEL